MPAAKTPGKSGRPRTNSTTISVSLSEALTDRLDAARRLHPAVPTRQDYVRHALSAYLANVEAMAASVERAQGREV